MKKSELIGILENNFSTSSVREVIESLRRVHNYQKLDGPYTKMQLLERIQDEVFRSDLEESMEETLPPGWDEGKKEDDDEEN